MMQISAADEMQPYRQALTRAFHEQRGEVCDRMNMINSEIGHGGGTLEEDLRHAQIVEQMSRHTRRALELWEQGQYREAMRELGWALAKGGGR